MSLNSLNFLLFLTVVVFIYYLVPKKYQWLVLLIASYGFYLSGGVSQIIFVLMTTLVSYGASHWMQKIRNLNQQNINVLGDSITKEQKQAMKKAAAKKIRRIQVATVLFHLGVLAYIKYLNFFIANFNELFGLFHWDASIPFVNVLVPLGLSYYTFNSIGYLIDVGRGKYEAEKHLGKFALFVSFFPSIVQGPLYRFGDVGKQLQQPHKFSYTNLKFGTQLILWGLFKKMVIADRVALVSGTVFSSNFTNYSGSAVLLGALAYSLQIYCDFSGGVDITRGAAQIMGINLPLNFERPFFATSMADFWRRWHMSLGMWMREYVFYPVMLSKPVNSLSKKFRKKYGSYAGKMVPSVAAPMVVFFLIGIWHGLTWQYILNGLYNAFLISSSVALEPVYKKITTFFKIKTDTFSFRLFQMLRTFGLLCVSRIIVRAPSLYEAARMLKRLIFNFDPVFFIKLQDNILYYGLKEHELSLLLVCVIVLLIVGILQESGIKIREKLSEQNILFRWAIILLLIANILIFGVYGPGYDSSAFIYGNF